VPQTPMLRVRNGIANKDALQRQPYVCSNGTFAVHTPGRRRAADRAHSVLVATSGGGWWLCVESEPRG